MKAKKPKLIPAKKPSALEPIPLRAPKRAPIAPPLFDERLRYTVDETTRLLKQSRAGLYNDVKAQKIQIIRHGGRIYFPGTEIARLSKLPA